MAAVSSVPSTDLEKRPAHPARTSEPLDEPSVEWGWHGGFPRGRLIGGIFLVIAMFGMFIGNHIGHVEDIYLGLTGVIVIVLLLLGIRRRRNAWRR